MKKPGLTLNPKSVNSLNWFAVICLIFGTMIMIIGHPESIILYFVSTICSLISVIFGCNKGGIAGIVILLASIILIFVTYPKFSEHMEGYMKRAREKHSLMEEPS
jgi:hypothetical protein